MGLLAETRHKQKWSVDPNNINWKKKSKKESFGHKLMSKMGWSDGQGLGKNSDGMLNHISAKVKNNNHGIGCDAKFDREYTAGQDEFNAVLKMLNDNDTSDLANQRREKKRTVTRKALNSRFVKAKDLSAAGAGDMAAIFGGADIFAQMSQNLAKKEESDETKNGGEEDEENKNSPIIKKEQDTQENGEKIVTSQTFTENTNHSVSKVSLSDYFQKKMAAKKAGVALKSEITKEVKAEVKEEISVDEETEEKEKKKKSKKDKKKSKRKVEVEETEEEPQPKKKKKSKKSKKAEK